MKLFICGNGFDQHHGLDTSYESYAKYLEKEHPRVFSDFESFPYLKELDQPWSDIEKSLNIDYYSFLSSIVGPDYSDVAISDNEQSLIDIQATIDDLTRFIFNFTGEYFFSWLCEKLKKPIPKKLSLSKEDFYISFNYSDTLETIYEIPNDHILHIHGYYKDVCKNTLLSHSILPHFGTIEEAEILWDKEIPADKFNNDMVRQYIQFGAVGLVPENLRKELKEIYSNKKLYSDYIEPAISILETFCDCTTKNLYNNYSVVEQFISCLDDVEEIHIMGHSCMNVDYQYYKDILIPKYQSCK